MDKISKAKRSANMAAIRAKDTRPEMIVRSLAHRLGFRFRLHRHDLPGKPDLVFPSRKKVIFVHGCFWHQHTGCREGRVPSSRPEYWVPKLKRNVVRDSSNADHLRGAGWKILTIWECQTANEFAVRLAIDKFLRPRKSGKRNAAK